MITNDFKNILEKISLPILIAEPLFLDETKQKSEDFIILFVNDAFSTTFEKITHSGNKLSDFAHKTTFDIAWYEIGLDVLKTEKKVEKTFYSLFYSHWFKVTVDKITDKLICVTFTNVDEDKLHEAELEDKNKKLEAMKDEISLSRETLKDNLSRINRLNEKLEFNAYHDMLTGRYGRTKFEEDFLKCMEDAKKSNGKFGIMLADIDNMKIVNDSYGHKKGDEIIKKSSDLLKEIETDDLRFYRFGSDEFVALMTNIDSPNEIMNMGNLTLEIFNAEGIEFSAGISVYPDDGSETEELLRYADMAMYNMKRNGKNNVGFFKSVMKERFMQRLLIQNKLSAAFGRNAFQRGFQQVYQPQFNIESGVLRGFEALLRWKDEDLGWISPEQFIPIAEETRIMIPLGDWVLESALKTLKDWETKFSFNGIMSVNVSPVQLKKPTFIFDLSTLIEEYGVTPKKLEIEITEGIFIDNKEEVLGVLNQVRAMGIGISLDDFGTGYSSLSYLQKLPITTLKIDKSFISNIENNGMEANITNSIVTMVSKMGLDTIAEGVENEEQLNILRQIKCQTVQGFLKGKPMTKTKCEEILQ